MNPASLEPGDRVRALLQPDRARCRAEASMRRRPRRTAREALASFAGFAIRVHATVRSLPRNERRKNATRPVTGTRPVTCAYSGFRGSGAQLTGLSPLTAQRLEPTLPSEVFFDVRKREERGGQKRRFCGLSVCGSWADQPRPPQPRRSQPRVATTPRRPHRASPTPRVATTAHRHNRASPQPRVAATAHRRNPASPQPRVATTAPRATASAGRRGPAGDRSARGRSPRRARRR
jgi:hypothetical protein